eukprot:2918180-Prymnesium_polylepis.1
MGAAAVTRAVAEVAAVARAAVAAATAEGAEMVAAKGRGVAVTTAAAAAMEAAAVVARTAPCEPLRGWHSARSRRASVTPSGCSRPCRATLLLSLSRPPIPSESSP